MKKTLSLLAIAAALTMSAGSVFAQDSAEEAERERIEAEEALKITGPFLKDISEEERKRATELGRSVANDLMGAYEKRMQEDKALTEQGNRQRKFADSIADEAVQAERDKALEFLGIDPQGSTGLYIFVSWSMPLELLRSYVLDAMWSGATVVFKGVPPNRTLGEFIMKDLKDLVYGKTAAANISIDPRLFDTYQVKTVPTIVYTTVRADLTCQGVERVPFTYENQELAYDTCPPLDPADYWKISGALSTNFALLAFKDAAAPGVDSHLKAIARGFAEGKVPDKTQLGFNGKWESILSPEETETIRSVVRQNGATTRQLNATDGTEFRTRQGSKLAPSTFDPKQFLLIPEPAKNPAPTQPPR